MCERTGTSQGSHQLFVVSCDVNGIIILQKLIGHSPDVVVVLAGSVVLPLRGLIER